MDPTIGPGQIETSASITAIAPAFVAAQMSIENATKDAVNPQFKSTYADLASVMDACRKPLNDNGIAIMQFPVTSATPNTVTLRTMLMHKSGEWMASVFIVPTMKNDAQGVGSALTYARRYALAAITGVCPEDDDGNAASTPPRQQAQPPARKPVQPPATRVERDEGVAQAPVLSVDDEAFITRVSEACASRPIAEDRALGYVRHILKRPTARITDLAPERREGFITFIEAGKLDPEKKTETKAA